MALITLSGEPGAGKTTVLKNLEAMGFQVMSSGEVFRKLAAEKGMDLPTFGKYVDEHPETDIEIDRRMKEKVFYYTVGTGSNSKIVAEGRLAGKLHKTACLKVWLCAPLKERARRIAGREQIPTAVALENTRARELCEVVRYKKYYNLDLNDLSTYDIVINTEKLNPQEVTTLILKAVERKMKATVTA
jgi:cytidylate kinase